tara:strand:- start:634 stop:1107 length:474 start_codon:yes stop_codon:yes gene_type:complete
MNIKSLSFYFFLIGPFILSSHLISQIDVKNEDLMVHKTSTCGCCKQWMKHAENHGFNVSSKDYENLEDVKKDFGILPKYRSCHTTVSSDGFVFEGHIPSKYVEQFLSEKHTDAIGLSVPGMPMGSPGMEVGDRFMPYDVLILFKDGSSKVYAEVNTK